VIEEALSFSSDGLALEARLSYAEDTGEPRAAVLVCPPHPFLGGDMDNNVIAALNTDIAAAGVPVFRFNYRGIGASECWRDLAVDQQQFWEHSSCPDYEAEILVDSGNAFAEFGRLLPAPASLYVVGYSFGTLPAIRIAASARVDRLCLISPPLSKWSLSPPRRRVPCGLFYAPGDFACPEASLRSLFRSLPEPKVLRAFDDADHFFVGRESDLAAAVRGFLLEEP
jgi:uncharacterized protein